MEISAKVLLLITSLVMLRRASSELAKDCKFGGFFDQNLEKCICSRACRFHNEHGHKRSPVCVESVLLPFRNECYALMMLCELTSSRAFGNPAPKIITKTPWKPCTAKRSYEERFCEDQNYCHNNGVCIVSKTGKHCRCSSLFRGSRCSEKISKHGRMISEYRRH